MSKKKGGIPTLADALKVAPAAPAAGDPNVPPDVAAQLRQDAQAAGISVPATAARPDFGPNTEAIAPEDLPDEAAKALLSPEQQDERRKQLAYGTGITNYVQTGAEAAARAATLGLSDLALTGLGADPEGLRERQARNEVSSGIGTVVGIVAPALLTGGAAGAELGLGRALAEATPMALVSRAGAAVGEAVTAAGEGGLVARIAAHVARNAAEGAIFNVGAILSGRALNGEALWDADAAGEYLASAGEGAGLGALVGAGSAVLSEGLGAAARGARAVAGKVGEAVRAPVEAAQAELTAAESADYGAKMRAAQQRLGSLEAEHFAPEAPELRAAADRAWLDASAKAGELPEAGVPVARMRADAPLEQIYAKVQEEANQLGLDPKATRSAWDRLAQGRDALANADADHAATVRRIVAHGDDLELRSANALDEISLARRNDAIRKALAVDRTAAPNEQIVGAFGQQVGRVRAELTEFLTDADPQLRSNAKLLDRFVADAHDSIASLDGKAGGSAAESYETLDQMNRVLGRVRDNMGENTRLGIGTMAEKLESLYEENRQLLKNPAIVGEQAAGIGARAKASWSDTFDSSGGYHKALTAKDAGGARLASGFETAKRYDPAKIAKWLRTINEPESQLQLELVARHIDARAKLLTTFVEDLETGPGATENIAAYQQTSKKLVDEILAYRSRAGLAEQYANTIAPAVKEAEAAEGKIAAAQAKHEMRAAAAQAKLEERLATETEKAGEMRAAAVAKAQAGIQAAQERVGTTIASGALKAVGVMIGGHAGGGLGALAGEALASSFTSLSTPVIRALSNAGLESAVRTDATMRIASKVAAAAKRMTAATDAIGQALHSGALPRAATKVLLEHGTLRERYDRAKQKLERTVPPQASNESAPLTAGALAATRTRAQDVLRTAMPQEHRPLQLRPDLDKNAAPQAVDQRRWLRQHAALQDPAAVIRAVASGDADPAAIQAIQAVYPKMMAHVAADVQAHVQKLEKQPSMSVSLAVGTLLGQPVHFTQTPEFAQFAQAAYQQQAAPPQPRRPSGSGKLTAATQSGTERAEAL